MLNSINLLFKICKQINSYPKHLNVYFDSIQCTYMHYTMVKCTLHYLHYYKTSSHIVTNELKNNTFKFQTLRISSYYIIIIIINHSCYSNYSIMFCFDVLVEFQNKFSSEFAKLGNEQRLPQAFLICLSFQKTIKLNNVESHGKNIFMIRIYKKFGNLKREIRQILIRLSDKKYLLFELCAALSLRSVSQRFYSGALQLPGCCPVTAVT